MMFIVVMCVNIRIIFISWFFVLIRVVMMYIVMVFFIEFLIRCYRK